MTALIARVIGALGLLALVASLAMTVLAPELPGLRTLYATAAVGLAGWLYLDWPAVVRFAASRGGLEAVRSVALLVVLAGVAAALVALSERHPRTWDLTPEQTHSLTPRTREALADLPGPVTITGWFVAGSDRLEASKRARWEALAEAFSVVDGLTVETVDPDASPQRAAADGIHHNGVVIVRAGERREAVPAPTEEALLNAILRVGSARDQTVYFATGAGERTPAAGGDRGLLVLREQLLSVGFGVDLLDLARTTEVPEDAALVVIVDPATPLPSASAETVTRWVDGGGALLVAAEGGSPTGLEEQLQGWGLALGPGLVLDPLVRSVTGDASTPLVGTWGNHAAVRDLRAPAVFPGAAPVLEAPHPAGDATVHALAFTSELAWAETTPEAGASYDEGADTPGPLSLLSLSELHPQGRDGGVVALSGDADWLSDGAVDQVGNPDLVVRLFGTLARRDELVELPPREAARGSLTMGWTEQLGLGLVALLLVPGLCFVTATGLWLHRRRL